jgi:hypothetical protein
MPRGLVEQGNGEIGEVERTSGQAYVGCLRQCVDIGHSGDGLRKEKQDASF